VRKEGREEGRKGGRKEGRKEGREEGRKGGGKGGILLELLTCCYSPDRQLLHHTYSSTYYQTHDSRMPPKKGSSKRR